MTLHTLLITLILLTPALARAEFEDGWEPPQNSETIPFHGAMTDFGARYGWTHGFEGNFGHTLDIGARVSFPLYLADLRLSYRYDQLSGDLQSHGAGLGLAIHPGFHFLLGNHWLWYTLASIYLDIGVGAQINITPQNTTPSLAWHWGAGVDIPLWNPDDANALWLNLLWRNHRSGTPDRDLNLSTAFLGLSYRFHNLPW